MISGICSLCSSLKTLKFLDSTIDSAQAYQMKKKTCKNIILREQTNECVFRVQTMYISIVGVFTQ